MWSTTICALSLLLPQEPRVSVPPASSPAPPAERAAAPAASAAAWSTFWWADYDGDGRDDAFVAVPGQSGRLLRNLGEEGFEDVTREAGLEGVRGVRQVLWSDVDGDGRLDLLLVAPRGKSALFQNLPGGSFTDVSAASGLELEGGVLFGEFTDYDADGDEDLFLAGADRDRFYRNLGEGVFEHLGLDLPAPAGQPGAQTPTTPEPETRGGGEERATTTTSGTSSAPAGTTEAAGGTLICADSIDDFANPGVCIGASSVPMLGMLYPLSSTFYMDNAGHVGVNTTTPAEALDVSGNVRATGQLVSTAAAGAPLVVGSSTVVTNLNADQLDGLDATAFSQLGATIGSAELEPDSVNSTHIAFGSVNTTDIANSGVRSNNLASGSVNSDKVADNTLTSADIANGTLTGADIASSTITGAHILSNSIQATDLATNSVGSSEIASNAVGSAEIAAAAVGSSEIAPNAVTGSHIASNAVGSSEIAPGSVFDSDVASAAAIRGSKIVPAFNQTVTTTDDLGVGTSTPDVDLHVVGDATLASAMFAPNEFGSGDDSELLLAEDENGTFGMKLKYDGGFNRLDILNRVADADDTTPNFSIARDSGDVQIGNGGFFQGRMTINATDTAASYHALTIFANDSNAINASNSWAGGATIYGDQNEATGAGIWGVGEDRGVYGSANDPGSAGVVGEANITTGGSDGVLGMTPNSGGRGVLGLSSATTGTSYGVWGQSSSTSGRGVYGNCTASTGTNYGVRGHSSSSSGRGVYGSALTTSTGTNYGVRGSTNSANGYGVFASGDLGSSGVKSFLQPHPTDPSKEVRFVCLEGNESGTYFRGSAQLIGGQAVIEVPEEFRLVSERDGLTVQLTAMGPAQLWVVEKSVDRIVVAGSGDVEFDYFVNGVRYGFADIDLVRDNHAFRPEVRGEVYGTQYPPKLRQRLVDNGILNADFTPNETLADELGWEFEDPEPLTAATAERQAEISRIMAATRAAAEAQAAVPPTSPSKDL